VTARPLYINTTFLGLGHGKIDTSGGGGRVVGNELHQNVVKSSDLVIKNVHVEC